jgi:hypothetical protein
VTRFDGLTRVCHRCGDWVQADEPHEEECKKRHQAEVNAKGIARVRQALARAREDNTR